MPEALSSAPGACGTVSRWAPTASQGFPGRTSPRVATTLTERPAGTGTPQDTPAGVWNGCRRTCQPRAESRRSTQSAARWKAGDVPGRGPISPARCRTAAIAVAGRTASMSARGARVGALGFGVPGLEVRGVGDAVALALSGAASRSGWGSDEHATRQISVVRVAGTAASRAMPRVNYRGQGRESTSGPRRGNNAAGAALCRLKVELNGLNLFVRLTAAVQAGRPGPSETRCTQSPYDQTSRSNRR